MSFSFLNKIKSFPEYHDMVDQSDRVRGQEVSMIDGYQKGYGEVYETYYKKQPEDLRESYEQIGKTQRDLITALQEDFGKKTEVQNSFVNLKQKQEALLAEYNKMSAREEEARKARDAATKEEARLAAANAKGNQLEIAKVEASQQAAKQKAETLTELATKAHADYDVSAQKHAVEFVEEFVAQMKKVIESEKKVASLYTNDGETIFTAGQKFSTINDPSIPKLEERLKQWEEYSID